MSTSEERLARNKKFDCLSPLEITVFNPIPDDPDNIFRTSPGDAQLHVDGEWDERDNWTPYEMRCAAQALIDAADYAESLGADLGVSS